MNKKSIALLLAGTVFAAMIYAAYDNSRMRAIDKQIPGNSDDVGTIPSESADKAAVDYSDQSYGFEFDLPESWRGYEVLVGRWEGYAITSDGSQALAAEGPQFIIRHPLWTESVPRQDIPIMIFTLKQWEDLQKDAFHIGAAPINPSELGRNNLYVFALPARYNYAFPEGYQEVERILAEDPLHPFDVSGSHFK